MQVVVNAVAIPQVRWVVLTAVDDEQGARWESQRGFKSIGDVLFTDGAIWVRFRCGMSRSGPTECVRRLRGKVNRRSLMHPAPRPTRA